MAISPMQLTIIMYLLFGYFLGRKLPFSSRTIKKIYFSIKRIPYWLVYIVEGGKIIDNIMIKKEKTYFNYGNKKYSLLLKNKEDQSFTPHIILDGYESVFYNKNNINPLVFKEKDIEPGYNDPEMFATLCSNREVQSSIGDSAQLLNDIKRYILIAMIVVASAVSAIVYFLINNSNGA